MKILIGWHYEGHPPLHYHTWAETWGEAEKHGEIDGALGPCEFDTPDEEWAFRDAHGLPNVRPNTVNQRR